MHNVWTVYILFITVNIVSQSQQMRQKKKGRKRELKNVDAQTQSPNVHYITFSLLQSNRYSNQKKENSNRILNNSL